jgi:hypothetical protein
MHSMKPALATTLVLAIATGSAYAIEVKKRIELPGEPQTIWEFVGDFCAIKDWHPAVVDCQKNKEGDAIFRTITLKDGSKIKEKLIDSDNMSYSYEIVESPFPVKNYKARFWVEADNEPVRSAVYWETEFDANGASDDDARKKITNIVTAGMKGVKQIALQHAPCCGCR